MKTILRIVLLCLFVIPAHAQKISALPETLVLSNQFLFIIADPGRTNYKATVGTVASNIAASFQLTASATNAVNSGQNVSVTNATSFGIFYTVQGLTNMQFFNLKQGTNMVIYSDGSNIVLNATGTGGGSTVSPPLSSVQFNSNGVVQGSSSLLFTNGSLVVASNVIISGNQTNLNTNAVITLLPKSIQRRVNTFGLGYGSVDLQVPNASAAFGVGSTKSAQGPFSFIGGGGGNLITNNGANSFIGAGIDGYLETSASFIGAGNDLQIINPTGVGTRQYNAIVGGSGNVIDQGFSSTIAGGQNNYIGDGFNTYLVDNSFVGGGANNEAYGSLSSILGGLQNIAGAYGAQVVGNLIVNNISNSVMIGYGPSNLLTIAPYGTKLEGTNATITLLSKTIQRRTNNWHLGYGSVDLQYASPNTANVTNTAEGAFSMIAAGAGNKIASNAPNSFVGGGIDQFVQTSASYIGAGQNNIIGNPGGLSTRQYNTIIGGFGNEIDQALSSVIGGGQANLVGDGFGTFSPDYGFVGGGFQNEVDNSYGAILGGQMNVVSANGGQIVGSSIINTVTNGVILGYGPSNVLTVAPAGTTNSGRFSISTMIGSGDHVSVSAAGQLMRTNIVTGGVDTNTIISVVTNTIFPVINVTTLNAANLNLTNALGSNQVRLAITNLTDVSVPGRAAGDTLFWNPTMFKWTNGQPPSAGPGATVAGNSNQIAFINTSGNGLTNYQQVNMNTPGFGFNPCQTCGPGNSYGGFMVYANSPMGLVTFGHPNPASDFAVPTTALVISNRWNTSTLFKNDAIKIETVMVGGGLSVTSTLMRFRVWQDTTSSNDVAELTINGQMKLWGGTVYTSNNVATLAFPTAAEIGVGGYWVGNSNGTLVTLYSVNGTTTAMKVLAP